MKTLTRSIVILAAIGFAVTMNSCAPQGPKEAVTGNAAAKVYVAPGQYDEFYNIVSGGFNGQIGIYGLPQVGCSESFRFSLSFLKMAMGTVRKVNPC